MVKASTELADDVVYPHNTIGMVKGESQPRSSPNVGLMLGERLEFTVK